MTSPMVSSRPAAPSTRWQLVIGPSSQAGPAEARRPLVRGPAPPGARRSAPAGRGSRAGGHGSQRPHRVGEGAAAVRVVAEDVHRRRGGGEQHGVAGAGEPAAAATAARIVASPVTPVPSIPPSSPLATVDHGDRRGVSRQRGGDLGPIAAQEDHPGQPRRDRGDQLVDVGALEQAAGDPDHARVGGQRGAGGVRVGRLAVVDVVHAVDRARRGRCGARPARKPARPRPTASAGTPAARASAAAASALTRVVRAAAPAASPGLEQHLPGRVGGERAVDQRAGPHAELAGRRLAERDGHRVRVPRPRARPPPGRRRRRPRPAPAAAPGLGVAVGGHRAVPVEVVVGDVEHARRGGRERGGPVQLEARQLHGEHVVGGRARRRRRGDHSTSGRPTLPAATARRPAASRIASSMADRRRLAVGAGDREPRRGLAVRAGDAQPPGQLRLPDHLHAAAPRRRRAAVRPAASPAR